MSSECDTFDVTRIQPVVRRKSNVNQSIPADDIGESTAESEQIAPRYKN